jgi:predicted O-linked N-acetylglucosamine transferase (SPINDLY family)
MSFDRAIAISPDYADAHHNRAGLMLDMGRHAEAVASYDTAIALRGDHAESHRGRGRALAALRKFDAALASFNRAVALRPEELDPRFERGTVLAGLGRHQEALSEYDKILAKEPDHAAALANRGIALQALGRLDEADASYRRAIELDPDDAKANHNRGVVLQRLERFEEALALHDHALALCPDDVDALYHRGKALQALERHLEAIACYESALAITPESFRLLNDRGAAFNEIRMHPEALASLDEAITIAPDDAEAHFNRGNALAGMGQLAEALQSYDKALLIGTPLPHAFGAYADCAATICDWTRTAQIQAALERHVAAKKSAISPFTLLAYNAAPALQLACARHYADSRFGSPAPTHGTVRHHDKVRIAYLSADFGRHATSSLVANLVEQHDRSRFQITGISFGADDGSEARARAAFDTFRDVRDLSDRDVAKLMKELEIDIAVDLKGYTKGARPGILRDRPAPIQVNYLGYPGTMGADFIDYIVADAVVVPPGEERHYAEKVVRLPDCYQVNDSRRPISERTPIRRESGLPERGFVFCSFNGGRRITAAVFDVWMRLLTAVEGSVLWLLHDNAWAEDNLKRAAAARGADPARLVFAARVEPPDHSARHRLADLFLDTLPCNGHSTCSDALWAGLPVLTCRGDGFAGRVAASLLQSVGLPELITSSLADYAALALWLARDPDLLSEIRKRLAENRLSSPLFDTDLSRRHLEIAYTAMWRLWQRGESPRSFKVEPGHDPEGAREAAIGPREAAA